MRESHRGDLHPSSPPGGTYANKITQNSLKNKQLILMTTRCSPVRYAWEWHRNWGDEHIGAVRLLSCPFHCRRRTISSFFRPIPSDSNVSNQTVDTDGYVHEDRSGWGRDYNCRCRPPVQSKISSKSATDKIVLISKSVSFVMALHTNLLTNNLFVTNQLFTSISKKIPF